MLRPLLRFGLAQRSLSLSCAPSSAARRRRTAHAIIIGNEVLSGKIQDTNSHTLAQFLFSKAGVELRSISVVPDEQPQIAEAVLRASSSSDFVFTTGGIGPTHDDITYESIASAFSLPLAIHEPTVTLMKSMIKAPLNEARLRMARFPTPARVLHTPSLWVPLVVVHNVHIYPGVPKLFEKMLDAHAREYTIVDGAQANIKTLANVFTMQKEGDFADSLTDIQNQEAAYNTLIGSYPVFNRPDLDYRVKITVEGMHEVSVLRAARAIAKLTAGRLEPVQAPAE